jgi:uncharacterized protein (TIRG00374 family)
LRDTAALWRRLTWTAVLGVVLYVALAVYADYQALVGVLSGFPWRTFPLVLLLTLGNYTGRLVKWWWYLSLVGARVGFRDAARIFGVAMTMVLTPGKAGELLKSYMVKNVSGTPMQVTAPIVLAERLTDGLAMLLLASAGLYTLDDPRLIAIAIAIVAAIAVVVLAVQVRPLAMWVLRAGGRHRALAPRIASVRDFYESSYVLLRPRNLALAVLIGTVSWSCEGLAYYLVLVGVGAPPSASTALTAIFIFSISSILGAVIATPGGLGGTEAGLSQMPIRLLGLTKPPATAAMLLVRFATLWFGVGLGIVCFVRWPELLAGRDAAAAE